MRNLDERPRAALLARVSTDRQHLDAQVAQLRREAARRGFDIVREETHVGTGRSVARPGLARVLAMAEAGEIDVILVAELSRIGRSLAGVASVPSLPGGESTHPTDRARRPAGRSMRARWDRSIGGFRIHGGSPQGWHGLARRARMVRWPLARRRGEISRFPPPATSLRRGP